MSIAQTHVCASTAYALTPLNRRVQRAQPAVQPTTALKTRRTSIIAMAEPRENVDEFATQGAVPGEEVPGFDYGHTDGHHMWKKEDESGFVSGNGYDKFFENVDESVELMDGPTGIQKVLLLLGAAGFFGIPALLGADPATSGKYLLILGAVFSSLYTVVEQIETIGQMNEETDLKTVE